MAWEFSGISALWCRNTPHSDLFPALITAEIRLGPESYGSSQYQVSKHYSSSNDNTKFTHISNNIISDMINQYHTWKSSIKKRIYWKWQDGLHLCSYPPAPKSPTDIFAPRSQQGGGRLAVRLTRLHASDTSQAGDSSHRGTKGPPRSTKAQSGRFANWSVTTCERECIALCQLVQILYSQDFVSQLVSTMLSHKNAFTIILWLSVRRGECKSWSRAMS